MFILLGSSFVWADEIEVKVLNTSTPEKKIERKKLEKKLSGALKASGKVQKSGPRTENGSQALPQ